MSGKRVEYALVWEQEKEVDRCFAEKWNLKGEWKDRLERMVREACEHEFGTKEYMVVVREIYEQFFKEGSTQRSDMASQYSQSS